MQVKLTVNNYKGQFLRSCSVTIIQRVTTIYRAITYRFDCKRKSIMLNHNLLK